MAIIRSEQFTGGYGKDRFSGHGGGIYIFREEIELAVEPFFLFFFIKVVQCEGSFLVAFTLPEIFFVRRMVVTMLYHVTDKFYGRIVFLTVVFAFGLYYNFIEGIRSGCKGDFITISLIP